jgi:shikimate kinase
MKRNIILTGFMGTGKSTVGQLVAHRLQRDFVDMDIVIEEREQRPISQIFAESGEPYFRRLEANLCQELAAQTGLVVATGGGTLIREANLQLMEETGLVICLDCVPEVLWQRIGQSENRPMLAALDEGRFARLGALLKQRAPAYARIERHIDVTCLSPETITQQICDWVDQEH